jgi:hypothetical protein
MPTVDCEIWLSRVINPYTHTSAIVSTVLAIRTSSSVKPLPPDDRRDCRILFVSFMTPPRWVRADRATSPRADQYPNT